MTQVVYNNRPRLSDAIGTLSETLKANRQRTQQTEEQRAKERADNFMKHALSTKLPQSQWAETHRAIAATDPAAARYIPNIGSLPPNQYQVAMDALEARKRSVEELQAKYQIGAGERLDRGEGTFTDPTALMNPSEIGKEPWRQTQLSDVLKGGTGASPDQVAEARVQKKLDPEANKVLEERTAGPLRTAQAGKETAEAAFTAGPKTERERAEAKFTAGPRSQEAVANAGKLRADARAVGSGGSAAPMPGIAGEGVTGEEYLKSLPPGDQRLIKSIADYLVDPNKIASLRNPKNAGSERLRLMKMVLQYDPTYDATQFPSRNKLRTDFNSGMSARNVRSLNTAIKHLESLNEAAKDLGNVGGIPLLSTAYNWGKNKAGQLSGDSGKVTFDAAATAVDNELASVFKGTGATDQEIQQWRGTMNSSMSPEQIEDGIKMRIELLSGRLAALSSQFQQGMGKPKDFGFLNASSRKALQKFGIDPDSLEKGQVAQIGGAAPATGETPSASGTSSADQQFIDSAMKIVNPATGKPYTADEAAAELRRRKGGA